MVLVSNKIYTEDKKKGGFYMDKKVEIAKEIESIRKELSKCIYKKQNLLDPEIIEISQKLDKILTTYATLK